VFVRLNLIRRILARRIIPFVLALLDARGEHVHHHSGLFQAHTFHKIENLLFIRDWLL
jgi:hypothetical protein